VLSAELISSVGTLIGIWFSTVEGRTLAEHVAPELPTGEDGVRAPVVNHVQHQDGTDSSGRRRREHCAVASPDADIRWGAASMRVCGIACVNDADELLSASLAHLALNGIRDFYLYNHGSDGTLAAHLAGGFRSGEIRLRVLRKQTPPFFHRAIITALAELARLDGFEIAVAFDADEFWCSTVDGETLVDRLTVELSRDVDALSVPVTNYVQHSDVQAFEAMTLLSCLYSVTPWVDDTCPLRDQVDAGRPFVAMPFPAKAVSRLSPDLMYAEGQHGGTTAQGATRVAEASGILVRHLSVPSRRDLAGKREHGRRRIAAGYLPEIGWQLQRLAELSDRQLDEYWLNNSWRLTDDGRPVVGDYDRLTRDDGLVGVGRSLARAKDLASKAGIAGDGSGGPVVDIPADRLDLVIQGLVDHLGAIERAAERRERALEDGLGGRLTELQKELDDRTEWALALQEELAAVKTSLSWRAGHAIRHPRLAWRAVTRHGG